MRVTMWGWLWLALWIGVASSARADTVVVVVRHAEKAVDAADPRDPPLSTTGIARAERLAAVVQGLDLDSVLVTPYQRTQLTAAPAAAAVGVQAEVLQSGADVAAEARALAERIRTRHADQTVLVVGHSNTIGAIVEALGVPAQPPVADDEFDRLYQLVLDDAGRVRWSRSRY